MFRSVFVFMMIYCATPTITFAGVPDDLDSALRTMADGAIGAAIRIRGIQPSKPLKTRATDKDSVSAHLEKEFAKVDYRLQLEVYRGVMSTLGVVDATIDLEAVLKTFARDQVAGYYDPLQKTLYVANWLPPLLQKPTLIHEATHALQDLRFDIGKWTEPIRGLSEPSLAGMALAEGDATAVMLYGAVGVDQSSAEIDRNLAQMMGKLTNLMEFLPQGSALPDVLMQSILFPYVEGLNLVLAARARKGWDTVNQLFANPPITTEQVLHPAKCLDEPRDNPREIALKSPQRMAGPEMKYIGTDVVGELGFRVVFSQSVSKDRAEAASVGWDGDRAWVFSSSKGGGALVLATVWDSEGDALEFLGALGVSKVPPVASDARNDMVISVWGFEENLARRAIDIVRKEAQIIEVKNLKDWQKAARH